MRQGTAASRGAGNSRRVVVAFLIGCVLLLILGPNIQPVASFLSPIYVPVESAVSGVSGDVASTISSIVKLPRLQQQNNELRRQNAVLAQEVADLQMLRRQNRSLTRATNFHDLNPHLDLQVAPVIGMGAPGLSTTLTIGIGSNDGVRLENPVLDENGFVIGKITQVMNAQSTVGLMTAGNIDIPALDSRTGARGLVAASPGESPAFGDIEVGGKVRAGDLVVTSGLWNEFPIGTLIGQVLNVRGGNAASFETATMHAAANLTSFDLVQVVKNFGPGARVNYFFHNGSGVRTP